MAPFVFDTLSASKQLREAGMAEGVAEAVVSVFQHAATMPDISHLATKDQVEALRADVARSEMATRDQIEALKADVARMATRDELHALKTDFDRLRSEMATKAELESFRGETQAEFKMVRLEIKASADAVRAEINDRFRQQTLALLGGMAFLITLATAAGRLFG